MTAHSTFVIERSYTAPPGRVFAAFADPAQKRYWYAGGDNSALLEHTLDFRVGGSEHTRTRMSDQTPFPGVILANQSHYLDIVPDRRLIFAYTMSLDGRRISASMVTVDLVPNGSGTDLIFTDQGAYFEGSDGPERREQGWKALLSKLEPHLAA